MHGIVCRRYRRSVLNRSFIRSRFTCIVAINSADYSSGVLLATATPEWEGVERADMEDLRRPFEGWKFRYGATRKFAA